MTIVFTEILIIVHKLLKEPPGADKVTPHVETGMPTDRHAPPPPIFYFYSVLVIGLCEGPILCSFTDLL